MNSTSPFTKKQESIIRKAIGILGERIRSTPAFENPTSTKDYCRLQLATKKDEAFGCMFLDSKHRLIAFEVLFRGTVDGSKVYPRVVVRRALELNAAAVVFTHNHPSGNPTPSRDDITVTKQLKDVLSIVDVRTLDHIIVGTEGTVSLAELGHI